MPRQITDSRFRLGEHQRQAYRASLEAGTTLDELRDPEFWRLLSRRVQAGDMIEAAWEDGSGFALLYVRAIPAAGRLVVELIAGGLFDDGAGIPAVPGAGLVDEQDGVRVEYAGQHERWRVVLASDGSVIKSGLGMQREARRQRTVYLQSIGRAAA